MSRTTYLVCETCKKYLWIGQSSIIYTGEPKTMEALNEFLQEHTSYQPSDEHKLLFMPEPFNGAYEEEDWEDVTDRTTPPATAEKGDKLDPEVESQEIMKETME